MLIKYIFELKREGKEVKEEGREVGRQGEK